LERQTTCKRALCEPYLAACPAAAARAHKWWVSGVFWSTQKEDVAHEISLLEKVECLEVLPFTPVEAHYHWQQVLILLLYWYKSTNIDAEYLVYRRHRRKSLAQF
jgi:hypothetical protein